MKLKEIKSRDASCNEFSLPTPTSTPQSSSPLHVPSLLTRLSTKHPHHFNPFKQLQHSLFQPISNELNSSNILNSSTPWHDSNLTTIHSSPQQSTMNSPQSCTSTTNDLESKNTINLALMEDFSTCLNSPSNSKESINPCATSISTDLSFTDKQQFLYQIQRPIQLDNSRKRKSLYPSKSPCQINQQNIDPNDSKNRTFNLDIYSMLYRTPRLLLYKPPTKPKKRTPTNGLIRAAIRESKKKLQDQKDPEIVIQLFVFYFSNQLFLLAFKHLQ